MNELQRYLLSGVALFLPIMSLFWLDIWRTRIDPAFRTAHPQRGRLTTRFLILTIIQALLAVGFPPTTNPWLRALIALGTIAASALIGSILFVILRIRDRTTQKENTLSRDSTL